MAGGRKSKPRIRNRRPLGLSTDNSPSKKNQVPTFMNDGWFISEPVASRLYQKSAIGKPISDGIIVSDEELMFCHWHRHIPLPEGWIDEKLESNPDFVYQVVAYDTIRSSGDKLVRDRDSWLLWNRETHPKNDEPISEVRWFKSKDEFRINSIIDWVENISSDRNCLLYTSPSPRD